MKSFRAIVHENFVRWKIFRARFRTILHDFLVRSKILKIVFWDTVSRLSKFKNADILPDNTAYSSKLVAEAILEHIQKKSEIGREKRLLGNPWNSSH